MLTKAGSSLANLLKVTVFLAVLGELGTFDASYCARLAGGPRPAAHGTEVARFRGDKRIEIDAVAAVV